jgi:hypothetical protein
MAIMDREAGGKKDLSSLPLPADAVRLLDQMLDLSPEEEEAAALEEMGRDPAVPLTSCVVRLLLRPEEVSRAEPFVLPNLIQDAWSRTTLREALRFADAPADHPAYELLKRAEERARHNPDGNVDPNGQVYHVADALAALEALRNATSPVPDEQWAAFEREVDRARPGQRSIFGQGVNPEAGSEPDEN